jgi:hypothetical protein
MTCIGGVVYNCGMPPLPPPINYPPQPQQPPRTPPPNPPPPRAYVETSYYLSFPPFIGNNVRVFWRSLNDYILPSTKEIALQWQYYPKRYARPRILTTTRNQRIYTYLIPFVDDFGKVYIGIDPGIPNPPDPLLIVQFLFHEQRWVAVLHEVYFPPVPSTRDGATPNDYRLALQSRTEKLVAFYDSAIYGLGSFTHRHLTIHLTSTEAFIQYTFRSYPEYYIQPTNSPAYCMFIDPY